MGANGWIVILATCCMLQDGATVTEPLPEAITVAVIVVEQGSNQPIEGMNVRVARFTEQGSVRKNLETTAHVTDRHGAFDFPVAPSSLRHSDLSFELVLDDPRYFSRQVVAQLQDLQGNGPKRRLTTIEIPVGPAISGRVELPDGSPAGGVLVRNLAVRDRADAVRGSMIFETETDGKGNFSFSTTTPGSGYLYITPKDQAAVAHTIELAGDQGVIRLQPGVVLSGTVTDAEDKPLRDLWVTAQREWSDAGARTEMMNRAGNSFSRSARTNAEGQFRMNPLPPGRYFIEVTERSSEPMLEKFYERFPKPLPAVFLREKMVLDDSGQPHTIDFQALPHVMFALQAYDSQGKPKRMGEVRLFGEHANGKFYTTTSHITDAGRIELLVPRGLQNVYLSFPSTVRHRMSAEAPLSISRRLVLGSVEQDILTFEVITYRPATLMIAVVDAEGRELDKARIVATYPSLKGQLEGKFVVAQGLYSDLPIHWQPDKLRWRASNMLPDEEVTLSVYADGYTSHEEIVTCSEGEIKELKVVLPKK